MCYVITFDMTMFSRSSLAVDPTAAPLTIDPDGADRHGSAKADRIVAADEAEGAAAHDRTDRHDPGHGHGHTHGHDHSHAHDHTHAHAHAHAHAPAGAPRPGVSLVRMSLVERLTVALVVSGLIWGGVLWAMRPIGG
jgi:hypothetical protein